MFTIQRFGGITRIFIELARELSMAPDVALYWYRGLHKDRYSIRDFRCRLARYWSVPIPERFFKWDLIGKLNTHGLNTFVKMNISGLSFDVYHPTYYDSRLINGARAKKLAITVHDMIPEMFMTHLDRFQGLIYEKRRLIMRADLVFVNSSSTLRDLLQLVPTDASKIRVTYWASRMKDCPLVPLPRAVTGKPYFLYVGTRSKYKNFEVLMRAFAENEWLARSFNVVCFGGTSPYLPHEMRFFSEHKLLDCFRYVSGGDGMLRSLYENAVALVYTSRYEGFGLPPLEAIQCGCPVICSPTSSLPEVVGEAALFFDVDAPEQLADCMRRVAEETELRERLVQKGYARAALFSWERTAQATLDGYRAVCG